MLAGEVEAGDELVVMANRKPMREYAEDIPTADGRAVNFEDFPFQEEWYSEEVANAREVVLPKCLDPGTRVLTADLRWVAIDDVQVGDELVGCDEETLPPSGPGKKRRARRLRGVRVEAKWETEKVAYRVTLSDGREIVASPDHRLLWKRRPARGAARDYAHGKAPWASGRICWCPVGYMAVGDRLRHLAHPWGEPDYEDGWMAGLLDGEGALRTASTRFKRTGGEIVIAQQPGHVLDRALAYLRRHGFTFSERWAPRPSGVPCANVRVTRVGEMLRMIGSTRPARFRQPWWEDMRIPSGGDGWVTIVGIERLKGKRRMVDIQTSRRTFVAEGVMSHNSAQIGASEWGWRGAVREADYGATGVYIFPTAEHVREFGDERIEPAIEQSPYLQRKIPGRYVKTKSLKRIGRGWLHLRGSNSKAGAQSVAASFLYFDEYDLLDQANLVQIERRISGAAQIGKAPKVRRLGYPFTPNDGIDAAWRSSDQRVWHVACRACGEEQPVTWEENFRWTTPGSVEEDGELRVMRPGADEFEDRKVVGDVWRVCKFCEASLEDTSPHRRDGALRRGRWIAMQPDRSIIGFHAWRGMVPITDLESLVVASRATKEAERLAFMVLDLGRPYLAGDAMLDHATLLRACALGEEPVEMYVGANPVTMGVDVAGERDLNVRIDEQLPPEQPGILNPRRALWIGRVKTFEQLAELMDRYRVWVCAIDSNPERRWAKLMRATFPGRVVLVEYEFRFDADPIVLSTDDAGVLLKARVHRTDAIDGMMDSIRQGRNRPLRTPPPGWLAQMKALVRKSDLDSKGRPFYHYVTTGTDGDDYAHADTYALVATEIWRSQQRVAQQLAQDGRRLPDEELGFRRARLDVGAAASWEPGMGEA